MKLTPEQRKEIGRLVQEKVPQFPPCAMCQNATGYAISGNLLYPDASGPYVAMSCSKCGHTLFFSAKRLGLDVA
ncbi:MAG TPA: hypothetical protein VM370_13500 [Candidatus Thermoplasmatota archaeon]|nr:hypothetical protein [Candidatus Thermoplasmatota archaeon]